MGHDVVVYNSHNHPYKEKNWNGVSIVHCYDPEFRIGTAGQFIYDLNCIIDARKRKFDIILQLGYTSSSVWSFLFPASAKVITNMDGLEWKRTKYGKLTQKFLRRAEALAVKGSHHLVADSIGIQNYLKQQYGVNSDYIAYGANVFTGPNSSVINTFQVKPYEYDMLIARLEPENNIDVILEGVAASKLRRKFLVIGNHSTKYGDYLKQKYANAKHIIFYGSLYDSVAVDNLRYFSNLYFHGHSVGGTNPSLLEAMASKAFIVAHKNDFNGMILGDDALYFTSASEVTVHIDSIEKLKAGIDKIEANYRKISTTFSWPTIIQQYATMFEQVSGK